MPETSSSDSDLRLIDDSEEVTVRDPDEKKNESIQSKFERVVSGLLMHRNTFPLTELQVNPTDGKETGIEKKDGAYVFTCNRNATEKQIFLGLQWSLFDKFARWREVGDTQEKKDAWKMDGNALQEALRAEKSNTPHRRILKNLFSIRSAYEQLMLKSIPSHKISIKMVQTQRALNNKKGGQRPPQSDQTRKTA